MKWIVKQDPQFKDLKRFSNGRWRAVLDLQYRSRVLAEKEVFAGLDLSRLKTLDFGAGESDFNQRYPLHSYHTVDPWMPATWKSVQEIPVTEKFDLIVVTEVLEHLEDPLTVLRSLARLQHSGQRIYVTTPFLAREHGAPDDFQRWTSAGLEALLKASGYQVEVSVKRGNLPSVLSALINHPFFSALTSIYFPLAIIFLPVVLLLLVAAHLFLKTPSRSTYLGLSILAVKS